MEGRKGRRVGGEEGGMHAGQHVCLLYGNGNIVKKN